MHTSQIMGNAQKCTERCPPPLPQCFDLRIMVAPHIMEEYPRTHARTLKPKRTQKKPQLCT